MIAISPILQDAHLHRRAYSLPKHLTLADIVVGVEGFEPTQTEGTTFTV